MLSLLVVEDEEGFLHYCAGLLRKINRNATIFTAASGEEALTILEQNTIDGAFLDIELPGMNGLTLAERIRDIERYHFLPVIFVTGKDYDYPKTYQLYRNLDYISKPFTEAAFIDKATDFIREIKAQKKLLLKKERVIILPVEGGSAGVMLEDILYAEKTPSRKIRVVTARHEYLRSYTTLEKFMAELDDEIFAYSTKSCIVNVSNIAEIRPVTRKTWDIVFRDAIDKKCSLSESYYTSVKNMWQKGGR